MRNIPLATLILAVLCSVPAIGQALETSIRVFHPDLTGTWKLNKTRSKGITPELVKEGSLETILIVKQTLPAIELTYKHQAGVRTDENFFGGKFTLYTDGRGDEYLQEMGSGTSVSEWKGVRMVVTHFVDGDSKTKEINWIEEYELSADNRVLNLKILKTNCTYQADFKVKRFFDDSLTVYAVFDHID